MGYSLNSLCRPGDLPRAPQPCRRLGGAGQLHVIDEWLNPRSIYIRHAVEVSTFKRAIGSASARPTSAPVTILGSSTGLQEHQVSNSARSALEANPRPALLLGG